jgi:hypothetical protein
VNNPSLFFSKSNFIGLNKGNDIKTIERIYHFISIKDSNKNLVCSEVFTNTGINSRTCYYMKEEVNRFRTIELSDLSAKIKGFVDEYGEDFFEILSQEIEEEPGDDFDLIDWITKRSVKSIKLKQTPK